MKSSYTAKGCGFRLGLQAKNVLGEQDRSTNCEARKLTNTVALLLSAMLAFACICVFGGKTPFASRVIILFGRVKSCIFHSVLSVICRVSPLTQQVKIMILPQGP